MSLPTHKRDYRLSDGNLILTGTRIIAAARRDAADILSYGWTTIKVNGVETLLNTFMAVRTDQELSALMRVATETKNTFEKTSIDYIKKQVMARVATKYAPGSPTYDRFGTKGIDNMTDAELITCFLAVGRQAAALQVDLAGAGLTPTIVTAAQALAPNYLTQINAQGTAIDNRDREVETRISAGNLVFKDLSDLAELGKNIWQGVSEAKYNDYVIYPGGTPAADQILEGPINAAEVINVSSTGINASTPIVLTAVTGDIVFGFENLGTDQPAHGQQTVTAGNSVTVVASDIGFVAGTRERFNVYSVAGGSYRIEVGG